MAIRALPFSDIQNPAAGLVDPDYLGYAAGDTNYALVSHFDKRLFIGLENTYQVFINDNTDTAVFHFDWTIRRFDYLSATWLNENLLGTNNITETGALNWAPTEAQGEGRYEISVRIYNNTNSNLATCHLVQNVFLPFTVDELQDEVNAAATLQVCNVANAAALGNPVITQVLIAKYWEYIVQESYRTPNPNDRITPLRLVNILHLFHTYYLANRPAIDSAPLFLPDTNKLSGSYRHGYQEICLCSAAMLAGATAWQAKTDDATTWEAVENTMQANFDALSLEQQMHLYNLLRFPKSLVRFLADCILTVGNQLPQNAGMEDLDRSLIKYFAFATPDRDLEALNDLDIVFFDVALRVPHFYQRNDPAFHINTIAANNLVRDDQSQDVLNLKNDLVELGFTLVAENIGNDNPPNSNQFNLILEWAVRDFQIYAKMRFLARVREDHNETTNPLPYHERLRRTPNLLRYTGPVSGVANEETRRLVKLWKVMEWRCPVVITAFTRPANSPNSNAQFTVLHTANIWRHNRVDAIPRIFVQDFSGYWPIPNNHLYSILPYLHNGKMVLGTFSQPAGYPGGPLNGAAAFLWVGTTNNNLVNITGSNNSTSTFRVIDSVQDRESGGFMEVVNCWDAAFLSMGYFHWTIGRLNGAVYNRGELQGLLSYFKAEQEDDPPGSNAPRITGEQIARSYQKIMLFFGLNTHRQWNDNLSNNACFISNLRNYTDDFTKQGENFSWQLANTVINAAFDNHNYHRTWHSFYRWVMALRTEAAFRPVMWRFARLRLRDLRNTSWGIDNANDWKNIKDQNGGNLNPTLGEVFSL
ncbi:MAG: hypothetical protein IPM36_24330 [Lewinellaceae bacterium]|nr:hypothetical protein [Lewinellaceae bacterium]